MNLLDRAIAYVAPGLALRREGYRRALAMTGAYKGASRSRRGLQSFQPGGGSADADLLPDLATLRERSRDLVRNAPLARGAIATVITNVVGTGLKARSRIDRSVLGLDEDSAHEWQEAAQREWCLWADSAECDYARSLTFAELQDLALRSTLGSGDVFALHRMLSRPGSLYELKLQLIEADRVSNPNRQADRRDLAGGVRIDQATGAPLGYWVTDRHPGDLLVGAGALTWEFLPAFGAQSGVRQVLHLYDRLRPDQNRGEPYLTPVIEAFKQLDRYSDAELMAAVVNACFAIVTQTESGGPMLSPLSRQPSSADGSAGAAGDSLKRADIDFQPGLTIDGLRPGESIRGFEGGRPNAEFNPFVEAVLRQIGVGLGLPFEVLIKHFTASYSAARAALLDAWRFFRVRRVWLARRLCQPTYEAVITEAVAKGRLSAPGFFRDPIARQAWLGCEWIGDAQGQIDPLKEAQANKELVTMGVKTLDHVTAETTGEDWSDVVEQRVREQRIMREGGLAAEPVAERIVTEPKEPGPDTNAPPADDQGTSDRADQKETA